MTSETGHGGKRRGAGRRPKYGNERTVTVAFTVPRPLADRLKAVAAERGESASELVTTILRRALAKMT